MPRRGKGSKRKNFKHRIRTYAPGYLNYSSMADAFLYVCQGADEPTEILCGPGALEVIVREVFTGSSVEFSGVLWGVPISDSDQVPAMSVLFLNRNHPSEEERNCLLTPSDLT